MPDETLTPQPDPQGAGADVTTRKCARCGDSYTGASHACATGPSGTIRTPGPSSLPLESTSKRCAACGEAYTGESHKDCASAGGTLKKAPSSKSRLDDVPAEAQSVALDPGRQLNQYLLVKQVGKGGMGTVWKAWDKKLTRWVAIKFLLATEEEDILRFQREAKLAARLRHPNIAPIYEVGEAPATQAGQQARHYLAMEYIDGQSMAAATQLPLRELLDIFVKVAQGVEAAHKAGVVHRDLKPQNVMLTSDRWPYVMDFGLAKALQTESSISVSGAVMGTPAYMPPEQAQGQLDQIDAQSDVYSLGTTMYAVLARKQPFTGQTPMEILMKVCKEDPVAPRKHNPEIPEPVEAIILKAMAKEKADRYPAAAAIAEDLRRFLAYEEVTARGPSSLKLAARKVKRNVWPIALGTLLLVAGGAIAALFARPKPEGPPVVQPGPGPTPGPEANPRPPEPGPEASAAQRAEAWYGDWQKVRAPLDYDDWKAEDADLPGRVAAHLATLAAEAPRRVTDVSDWFEAQTVRAQGALQGLPAEIQKRREAAARLVGWCDAAAAAGRGLEALKPALATASQLRASAATIANYRGSFTLKIVVGPFAELTRLARDGQALALPSQRFTPISALGPLQIGDYELELSHPQLGKKIEKIGAGQLRDGGTYRLSGHLADPKLTFTPLP